MNAIIPGVAIRPAVEDDLNFILSSWLHSYLDRDNDVLEIKRVRDSVAKAGHRRLVASLLSREDTTTLVACKEDAQNVIVGWACLEGGAPPHALHYAYVKADFRRVGIARELCQSVFSIGEQQRSKVFFSHYTRVIDEWRAKWEPQGVEWVFDPYAALEA